MVIDEFVVIDAMQTKLESVTNLNVYVAQVPDSPPNDPDYTVAPYVVIWPGGGLAFDGSVVDRASELDYIGQVTCAGGTWEKCVWAIKEVRKALTDQRLVINGDSTSQLKETIQGQTIRRDDDIQPSRFWYPIQYRLLGTRNDGV